MRKKKGKWFQETEKGKEGDRGAEGVIAERIERVQLHLMEGEKGVIAMRERMRERERNIYRERA